MTTIYVLRLERGNYYIGKSNNVANRYKQHLNGEGSAWTKKYKPIALEKVINSVSSFEEDKITKEYMAKYGIDKVRGGSYVNIDLNEFQMDCLKTEIWAANNLCTQCGRAGHFAKNCYAKTDITGKYIEYEWECEYCNQTFTTESAAVIHEKSCNSKKDRVIYSNSACVCYRCGRPGHYSTSCYASKHINGYYL